MKENMTSNVKYFLFRNKSKSNCSWLSVRLKILTRDFMIIIE